jgi:hypothetical protein
MGTYKDIQGYRVESLSSDPSASADNEGKIWYNSSSNVWKIVVDDGGLSVKTLASS